MRTRRGTPDGVQESAGVGRAEHDRVGALGRAARRWRLRADLSASVGSSAVDTRTQPGHADACPQPRGRIGAREGACVQVAQRQQGPRSGIARPCPSPPAPDWAQVRRGSRAAGFDGGRDPLGGDVAGSGPTVRSRCEHLPDSQRPRVRGGGPGQRRGLIVTAQPPQLGDPGDRSGLIFGVDRHAARPALRAVHGACRRRRRQRPGRWPLAATGPPLAGGTPPGHRAASDSGGTGWPWSPTKAAARRVGASSPASQRRRSPR